MYPLVCLSAVANLTKQRVDELNSILQRLGAK